MRDTKFRTRLFLCFLAVIVMTLVLPGLYVRKNIKEDGIDETVRNDLRGDGRADAILTEQELFAYEVRCGEVSGIASRVVRDVVVGDGNISRQGENLVAVAEQCGLRGVFVRAARDTRLDFEEETGADIALTA